MNEWPEGWFRDGASPGGAAAGQGAAAGSPGAADPTVRLPAGAGQPGAARAARPTGATPPAGPVPPGGAGPAWPAQPPPQSRPVPRGPGSPRPRGPGSPQRRGPGSPPGGPGGHAGRRRLRPRRIIAILSIVVALLLVVVTGMYFYLNSQLVRKNVLVDYAGRPAASAGQNWLIAGSDSRQGLTVKQERRLATGFDVGGKRSDSILILHIPANGGPSVLVSLPRDSYVPIPGYGDNKINAAYSFGGPKLLAKTVQNVTGLRIDHYMGIGFGGFVSVVNAVGGVRLCLKTSLYDQASGARLKKGCQTLNGGQALAYVRTRHNFSNQDLQRVQDQRVFLRALLTKMTSPGVMLNPFAAIPAAVGATDTLTVDQGTSLYQLIKVAFALRHPETTTVPIANSGYVTQNAGDAVQWNSTEATQLFNDLRSDRRVPKSLLTGSKQAG
jgi:LCP family protein required for cell wall assembly